VPAEARQRRSLVAAVIIVCVCYEILMSQVPFRATVLEFIYTAFGAVAVALVMTAAPIEDEAPGTRPKFGCLSTIALLLLPIVLFTSVLRVNQAQRIAESYDGVVSQKYHSHNHGEPTLVVRHSYDWTITVAVPSTVWDAAVEGRSHLSKPAWSAFGELDGKRMRIVPNNGLNGFYPD
jgi:hypothetical protein